MRGADSKNNSFLLFGPLCARLTMPTASSLTPRARLGVAFFFFFFLAQGHTAEQEAETVESGIAGRSSAVPRFCTETVVGSPPWWAQG